MENHKPDSSPVVGIYLIFMIRQPSSFLHRYRCRLAKSKLRILLWNREKKALPLPWKGPIGTAYRRCPPWRWRLRRSYALPRYDFARKAFTGG